MAIEKCKMLVNFTAIGQIMLPNYLGYAKMKKQFKRRKSRREKKKGR